MDRYIYDGPVKIFGVCVRNHWTGETVAASVSKARSNLAYRYKRMTHRAPDTRVELPGKFRIME